MVREDASFVFIMNHITIFMLNTAVSTASYSSSEDKCTDKQIRREKVKTEIIFYKRSQAEKRICFTV